MSSQRRGGQGAGKRRSGKKAKSARKAALPAFGFSDDLLKGKKSARASQAERRDAPKAAPKDAPKSASEDSPKSAPEDTPKKVSLPAFGFAEDLLRELKGEGRPAGDAAPDGRDAAEDGGGPFPTATAAAAAAAPAAAGAPQGEERIFAFADSLEAAAEEEKKAPVRRETWVTFKLAGETFALPVAPVIEIVRPSVVTRVPHAPYPIRGVTNLRGRVVPVIDLRLRLELPEGEILRSSRIVVVGSRGRRLGLLVDAVHQVVHLETDRIQPPPDDVMTVQSDYIIGVYHLGRELILLLDVDRVLIIKEPSVGGAGEPAAAEPAAGAAASGAA